LSRRRFKQKSRAIINEEELEAHLIKHGVQIVYPETLDLYNQVLLFNTRSQIIACFGSAIHTALFSFNPGLRMFVLVAENTNLKTAKLIDSLTKTKTFYIPALKNIKTLDRPDFLNDKTIDIANVVYQLYKHNVI
jgi:capsular polysaccharide biosynthesis protein